MVNSKKLPFPSGWYTAGHGALWDCDSTYCFVSYEALPPLDMRLFEGKFQWLFDSEDTLQKASITPDDPDKLLANLNHLTILAGEHGLELPDPFSIFLASPDLQRRVPIVYIMLSGFVRSDNEES